ncbi:MAG TPA: hypothetical protein VGI46_06785 [Candidatus Acidoferrum sp.]|jgi:prefoldin subunit 5
MVDLHELASVSKKLNQKSDTLNATIESLNLQLGGLNLGVEAWVGNITTSDPWYRDDDEDQKFPLHEETWLGYYRFDRGWELAVKTVTRQQTETYNVEETIDVDNLLPLTNASREIRIKAMKFIPELLDAIKETAEELLQSIAKAEQAAQNLAKTKLTLRKFASVRSGLVAGTGETYQYAVDGLPSGQEASIANMGSRNQPCWQILRRIDGVQGDWAGKYETATHALAALQGDIESFQES